MRLKLLGAALIAVAGCKTSATKTVTLQIADVTAPTELVPGAAMHLSASVASGGCTTYDHIDVKHSASQVTLQAIGTTSDAGVVCPDLAALHSIPVDVDPPFTDPVAVIALEPDGSTLVKSVRIRTGPAQ